MFISIPYSVLLGTLSYFHIFSHINLHSFFVSTDKVLYQQLNTTDLMQAKSYIMMSPKNVSFLLNKSTGGIILKSADISELGQRQLLASTVTATKAPQVSENADEKMARMFANRTIPKGKSVADSASFFGNNKSTTKSSSTASSTAASSKKEDDNKRKVNNMFANNPVKKEVVSAVPSAPESSKNNDEDDEWDDGVGYKPDKNKLKKSRKESDEMNSLVPELAEKNSDDIADLAVETTTENTDSSPQNPASKKAKTFVHGAMDDYMEDVAVAMEIAKENNPQQVAGVKKMKKKLVEKLYSTEDGYLETRYEYEEVTDDEVQVEKKPSPKKAAAKKDEKKASAGQQKGMMSFFSKK